MIKHIFKLIWNKKGSNALMILEIFLSFLVLFAVVGYVLFNFENLKKPMGFDTEDRWMVQLDGKVFLKDSLDRVQTLHSLKAELLAIDEVEDVSFIQSISPFSHNSWTNSFTDGKGHEVDANMVPTDVSYGELMNVNVIEGRWYTEADLQSTHIPMVVNQHWLEHEYEGKSMIDSIFTLANTTYKIVGVVEQNRYQGEFEEETNSTYLLKHFYENPDNIILKMRSGTQASVEETISKTVNTISKTSGSVINSLDMLKEKRGRDSWVLMIALLSICGFLCINVALGLFGVLSYNINKRRSEIGLRQAVGAHGYDIAMQFILEILILTGLAVGLGIFFAIQIPLLDVTEFADSLFYRAIMYSTIIILGLVLACALLPGLQAAKISPANALHEDS